MPTMHSSEAMLACCVPRDVQHNPGACSPPGGCHAHGRRPWQLPPAPRRCTHGCAAGEQRTGLQVLWADIVPSQHQPCHQWCAPVLPNNTRMTSLLSRRTTATHTGHVLEVHKSHIAPLSSSQPGQHQPPTCQPSTHHHHRPFLCWLWVGHDGRGHAKVDPAMAVQEAPGQWHQVPVSGRDLGCRLVLCQEAGDI
jgi:hypothetical protein